MRIQARKAFFPPPEKLRSCMSADLISTVVLFPMAAKTVARLLTTQPSPTLLNQQSPKNQCWVHPSQPHQQVQIPQMAHVALATETPSVETGLTGLVVVSMGSITHQECFPKHQ